MEKNSALQRMLDAPLSTARGGDGEKEREPPRAEQRHNTSRHERKRQQEPGVEVDLNRAPKRHNGRDRNNSGGVRHQQHRGPQGQQRWWSGSGSQRGPNRGPQPERYPGGIYPAQRRRQDGPPGGGRRHPGRQSSGDDETHFKYRWTLTADNVQILSVLVFGTELMTISSNGNLRLDATGSRSFRHYQALNMCLQPLQLKVIPSEGEGEEASDGRSGYRGGHWKLKHLKHGWTQDFVDGMKLSAFPNRDWKRILPKLKALPQSVVFSYETENF